MFQDTKVDSYNGLCRYMYEVMQVLRQQYQGSLPISSIENYLNTIEDLSRNTHEVNEKLDEIEDVRSSLMAKHSIFNQILDVSKSKCLEEEDSCPHKLQHIVMVRMTLTLIKKLFLICCLCLTPWGYRRDNMYVILFFSRFS